MSNSITNNSSNNRINPYPDDEQKILSLQIIMISTRDLKMDLTMEIVMKTTTHKFIQKKKIFQ